MSPDGPDLGTDLLFVYGSLRRASCGEPARTLHDACEWLGTAEVRGRLFRVDWYPALILDPAAGRVTGDLFRLTDVPAMLALLDDYEEIGPSHRQPWEYRREIVAVDRADGPVRAWTYLYNHAVGGLEPVPGGDWLRQE